MSVIVECQASCYSSRHSTENPTMTPKTTVWVIINHDELIVHQTTNPETVELMKRYVLKAREAGDDWKLVEYRFEKIIQCDSHSNKVAS